MKQEKKELFFAVAVIFAFFVTLGVNINVRGKEVKSASVAVQETNPKVIKYQGKEGKSAFELLKVNNQVVTQESSLGVFVTEINGIKNTDKEFWLFYVNGELALVGADQYITKEADKIEWRFEKSPF